MAKYRADAMFYGGLFVEKPTAVGVLSNEIGGVVTYSGRQPTYLETRAPELYAAIVAERSQRGRCAYCGTRAHGRHCDSCGAPT